MNKEDNKSMTGRWIGCPLEDQYFGDDRKARKLERKIASGKDRSKYKKTDKQKIDKAREIRKNLAISKEENLLKGRVLSIISQGIVVEYDKKNYICTLRGLLKKEKGSAKNLVVVGDFVLFEKTSDTEGVIAHIDTRKTFLSRADNLSRRKEQLIAANIDQVIITTSVVDPELKPYLIDRYILASQKGGMEPLVVINKIDLLEQDTEQVFIENEIYKELLNAYDLAGIKTLPISVVTGAGIEELRKAMQEKVSVFSGQSGVGKTSLINAITGLNLKVGKTVDKTKKGAHTTSSGQLIPLEFGGWCVDTPGIKSFGLWDLKIEEIERYYTEIHGCAHACKFLDCSHTHEDDCAVIKAVEEGKISSLRYESYQALMNSVSEEHVRR